jgi:hypothetical protein
MDTTATIEREYSSKWVLHTGRQVKYSVRKGNSEVPKNWERVLEKDAKFINVKLGSALWVD